MSCDISNDCGTSSNEENGNNEGRVTVVDGYEEEV